MATAIIEETKDKRSFMVEQYNNEYITVKKTKNNKEYEVEVIVFAQSDIDEFVKIQEEIYRDRDINKQDLMERLVTILRKWKGE
jgi:hypothetical protein